MQKRKVAIFDVDGTIFRSSLLIELVNVLIEHRVFPEEAHLEYQKEYQEWINRHGPYGPYIAGVVKVFMKYIIGKDNEKVLNAAQEVLHRYESRTYKYTHDLIKKLKEEGYYLLLISHSPKFILENFGKKYGFDKIYGKVYTVNENGKFTGEIQDHDLINNKAEILKRATEKENLTLEDSVGVGDTDSDISFLSLVSKPICFNPNKALYEHAKEKGWLIVVERKDVIYEISGVPAKSM